MDAIGSKKDSAFECLKKAGQSGEEVRDKRVKR
jgi:hypothetical protein